MARPPRSPDDGPDSDPSVSSTSYIGKPAAEQRARGGGEGPPDGMSDRITRLETHMEHLQGDFKDIKAGLGTLLDRTSNLPTKKDLTVFNWQTIGTAAAVVAIIVTGIIGGLSWIKPEPQTSPQTAPIVISVPIPAPVTTQTPSTQH